MRNYSLRTKTALVADKTAWDWIQLALQVIGVFAIPISIYIGIWQFNEQQRGVAQQQLDQQQQTTLEIYLDRMSELVLDHDSNKSEIINRQINSIARARTLTALERLDPDRKKTLLLFLNESRLINYDDRGSSSISARLKVDLRTAKLSFSNLEDAHLPYVNLGYTFLDEANLKNAILKHANLELAFLFLANLENADLRQVNLKDAYLEYANLKNADLESANLEGARLKNAKLEGANLKNIYYSNKTIWPKDFTPPKSRINK